MANGRGVAGLRTIDQGPFDMGELAQLFRELSLDELAGAWVGCVVDSVTLERPRPGDTARALIVVAERLHGVRFREPVTSELKMALPRRSTSHLERPLGRPEPQSPFAQKATKKTPSVPVQPQPKRVPTPPPPLALPAIVVSPQRRRRPNVQRRGELSLKVEAMKPGDEIRVLLREHGGQHTRVAVSVMVCLGKKNGWNRELRTRVEGQHVVVWIPKEEA